jgi:nucleoside 2-deoxyribosyltransferase
MKIYLAHPFDERHAVREWQLNTKIEGVEFINPFYDITRADIEAIDKTNITRAEIEDGTHVLASPETIVRRDIEAISACDVLMAYHTNAKSIGTLMEMVYGFTMGLEMHSVCVASAHHPWIQYHSDKVFDTLGDYRTHLENANVTKPAGGIAL